MSDHQPLPVAGYTTQSAQKVALVNQNKQLEEKCLRQMDLMRAAADDSGEFDVRWLSIARTNLELAFMAMNRAVFKPTRVQGDV
jgi:hypothetical protein